MVGITGHRLRSAGFLVDRQRPGQFIRIAAEFVYDGFGIFRLLGEINQYEVTTRSRSLRACSRVFTLPVVGLVGYLMRLLVGGAGIGAQVVELR
jgi:hypothetical protein